MIVIITEKPFSSTLNKANRLLFFSFLNNSTLNKASTLSRRRRLWGQPGRPPQYLRNAHAFISFYHIPPNLTFPLQYFLQDYASALSSFLNSSFTWICIHRCPASSLSCEGSIGVTGQSIPPRRRIILGYIMA